MGLNLVELHEGIKWTRQEMKFRGRSLHSLFNPGIRFVVYSQCKPARFPSPVVGDQIMTPEAQFSYPFPQE
ncbi:hypothetical protein EUGRSUZ_B00391 [Eucalyptus grandis]|uniref:Uncharacterized protein n=2 Tax=Eucalyptus grandis TaxID=71139 RepID=A0ACC3LP04_EUCGR|nr:hypothetical protein EUGRSUZ_B00391 [Eucalyptus grandis]